MLRGTEAPICCLDNLSKEVCCLPGANICDIRKRIPGMIKLNHYCALLAFQGGSHEAVTRKLKNIKRDFASFEKVLRGSGVRGCFPLYSQWETGI